MNYASQILTEMGTDFNKIYDRYFLFLEELIISRFQLERGSQDEEPTVPSLPFQTAIDEYEEEISEPSGCPLLDFQQHFLISRSLGREEMVIILLALAPHVYPELLGKIILKIGEVGTEFGGIEGKHFRGVTPTIQTALFILAGNDFQWRFELQKLFREESFLVYNDIIQVTEVSAEDPWITCPFSLSDEYLEYFTTGEQFQPRFGMSFPASRISTHMEWDDLVLRKSTMEGIDELKAVINSNIQMLEAYQLDRKVNSGWMTIFHGPPGTGKTLTAKLLGKEYQREVYRIDLSMVVSKYIGETEKNLEKVFRKANSQSWILFFDEADALFGKRTDVKDAHDRYANQEVSYLLQRIEDYHGLVIIATNFLNNIDDAFRRRFKSFIRFYIPDVEERMLMWERMLPANIVIEDDRWLEKLSKYELTGSNIMNIVHRVSLQGYHHHSNTEEVQMPLEEVERFIKLEFEKEFKSFKKLN